ncbi:hypothetical protein GTP45_27550 [Pseudoduganella sp. FT55W]|uniref:Uncharacterized protein n=1 Tax=Duganella rivi TaxID=2666083 RepID=A0A7X4KFJ7_9BURK|nr:hypothetical protein [Duganella rivi]MYM70538.1 hypothetical protein [Duganella rivi]
MAVKSGDLGGGTLEAGKEKIGYACAAPAVAATITVSFCNKSLGPVKVRLALGPGADSKAAGTRFLEFDSEVGKTLERTGIAVSAGTNVFVQCDQANTDYAIYGYEKQ